MPLQSHRGALFLGVAAAVCLLVACLGVSRHVEAAQASSQPDSECERCHAEIVQSYRRTAMAQGSGPAAAALLPGLFTDSSSGVSYRVRMQDGSPTMSFLRSAADPRGGVSGAQRMEYFVGSGRRGRTYLYQQEGLWFELPINYYTRRAAWDLAPNYGGLSAMPPALPVDPNCLHCHASGVSAALPRARNAFVGAPFTQGGIGCGACHGDAAAHIASDGKAPILNPAKLDPVRRDSVCLQCHLEGDAVIYRSGKSLAAFHAGDDLRDTAAYFVRGSRTGGGARATSQYEALLQSACKRASGDRMTCTTCHDPHSSPAPLDRVAFYRARCLQCHTAPSFRAGNHHPEQQDCAICHMPTRQTSDISHEQVTDHNIQAVPRREVPAPKAKEGETLQPVGSFGAGQRELGLAYAQMALRGDRTAAARALQLLLPLEAAADQQVAVYLGFLLQVAGSTAKARAQYERVLQMDPAESTALANLAVLDASEGRVAAATELLRTATRNDPSQPATAGNLALLLCRQGQKDEAKTVVAHALRFNPDSALLRRLERSGCPASP